MDKEKLVLIGNGMAGVRALEELLKLAPEMYDITVFGAEPHPNYNRIMLSPVLAGEKTLTDIVLNDLNWYEDSGIRLKTAEPITRIDRIARKVISESGQEYDYDRLLLATGSNPLIIPIPGHQKAGVISFRNVDDVNVMLEVAERHSKAIVIGGGPARSGGSQWADEEWHGGDRCSPTGQPDGTPTGQAGGRVAQDLSG